MYHAKNIGILLLLSIILSGLSYSAPPTKFDYLTRDYQECGIVRCATYYTATNPTASTITFSNSSILKVSSKIDYMGTSEGFKTEILNASNSWQDITNIQSLSVKPGEKIRFRIIGKINPIYQGRDRVSYAIDHIPSMGGFSYPEYDLWNQTWNKCLDVNITYNLGNYSMINETFPQRILLNATIINLSAIRFDWGDIRFTKGTCANVSTDYLHNFVYKNSSQAEAIFYMNGGDIVNNTPSHVAIYYNNSGVTHLEPNRSDVDFGNGNLEGVRIFTNDVEGDTDSVSNTSFNDSTTQKVLNRIGTTSIMPGNKWKNGKSINTTNSILYTPISFEEVSAMDGLSGWTTAFDFKLYNWNLSSGTFYLYSIGNATNHSKTNVIEAYLVIQ